MRLIDATDLVRRVLVERDKIKTEVVERYSLGVPTHDRHGQAMRGGIRKALREIETSPTVDAVEVVRCKDCVWYQPNWIMGQDVCGKIMHNALRVSPNFFCQRGERKEDNNGKDN